MTIDEAIEHAEEVAEQNEFETRIYDELNRPGDEEYRNNSCQCAESHRQLAEWLRELKELRAEQDDQYVFIHELMSELKEAKRLLDMALCELNNGTCSKFCSTCTKVNTEKCLDYKTKNYRWIHTDEALKLIGEDIE